MVEETLPGPSEQPSTDPARTDPGTAPASLRPPEELSRTLHGLNNALHGMSLRLVLLRNDPETMAKHEATVEALRRGIRAAAEEIDRLEALLAETPPEK